LEEEKMKRLNTILVILFCLLAIATDQSQAGVSISVGEPGFYGRIDIGGYPAPRLLYPEPIIVHRVQTWYPPIYLRVPPKHANRWYKYCHRYNACGRPVYFIDDGWYRDVYVPRYRERYRYPPPSHRPPHVVHPPRYYEYRKYEHRPPKKVYIRERDRDHRDRHEYRDRRDRHERHYR
jgi:hypothetical protein